MKKLLICTALISFWGMSAEAINFINDSTISNTFSIYLVVGVNSYFAFDQSVEAGQSVTYSPESVKTRIKYLRKTRHAQPDSELEVLTSQNKHCYLPNNEVIEVKDAKAFANATVVFKAPKENPTRAECYVEFKK